MNELNNTALSFNSKVLLFDKSIGEVIELFLSTFLAAYFYKITTENMVYISAYHIITWIFATLGAFLLCNYIKTKNKVALYRFGTLIKAIFILLIVLLQENILNYVWLIGICYGLSVATTGFPFNMIESESVCEKERTKYMGYKTAVSEFSKVVVPIFLGAYITLTSYEVAAALVLVFSIIKLIDTLFIKNLSTGGNKINLKKFKKAVKENSQYPIKKLYIIEFLKGMTVHGVLNIVISLLIIYEVKTDLNLGLWSSFFSICSVFAMIIFARKYNKHDSKFILTICAISILTSFVLLLFSINMTTIIIYNLVYYIFVKIVLSITEIRLFDYSNMPPFAKDFNSEYFLCREFFINAGRIIGYVVLLFVGLSHNMDYLKILFLITTIALITVIVMTKNLSKNENIDINIKEKSI